LVVVGGTLMAPLLLLLALPVLIDTLSTRIRPAADSDEGLAPAE